MKQILLSKYRRFVRYVEIIIAVLMLGLMYHFIPVNEGSRILYLPSSDINETVHILERNGYTVTPVDKLMLMLQHTPQKGWYDLEDTREGRFLFFKNLHKKRARTMEVKVYAGETADELLERLAADMKLDKAKLREAYRKRSRFQEADIFAGRYTLARKADENTTIQYLMDTSFGALEDFTEKYFQKPPDDFTLKVLLTIASIIQKESNSAKEMPLISSVIHNRLTKGMKLQMDSTLNYGEHSHRIITSERIKNDTSYYNTYKYKGLPPSPLGTVTMDALKAAMSPAKSDYLFFMLNAKGEHDFSATYEEHLKNLRAFRAYLKEKKLAKAREKNEKESKKSSGKKKGKKRTDS